MPAPLVLQLTDAGLAAVQAASGSDPTVIAELGLTDTPFDYAPTLDALPGEFKRLPVTSGVAAAPNIAHLTVYDTSADVWNATGFGLFLDDGTLFAVYTQPAPVLSKAGLAFALLAFDIAFNGDLAADIAFGDATFIYPPATEDMRGVAEIATQDEVNTGTDDEKIVTPSKLKTVLDALSATINGAIAAVAASVAALTGITITGGGLVSGGGDLSANRVLTVTEASAAEITAGTAADKVVTPRRLGPISILLAQNGYIRFFGLQLVWGRFTANANTTTAATFPLAFDNACFSVVASGVVAGGADSADNPPAVIASTITTTGFSVFSADETNDVTCFFAVGY